MKLIDADKLKLEETARIQLGEMQEHFALISYSKKQIEEAPTVEAIPIEWIKDYVDFGVSDELAQRYRRFVLNMIKDWEKEERG